MKRPPELWFISFGLLCVTFSIVQNTQGLRATSLIFAKTSSTTSTTSTTEASSAEDEITTTSETSTEVNQTATKPPLTGIPQIDYIWDPNLPFELRGYNLSDYPFYDGLPNDIDFKCDGLHDGFYASTPHKCQVYHHCLFGTRYDFLCANFTAFDQKTFICHFVSEVDCNNSRKYWHRNDALYQVASTTTPSTTTVQTVVTSTPLPTAPRRPLSPGLRRRRPYRRRRPQYDYYEDEETDIEDYDTVRGRHDDYYDEPSSRPGRRRRKRPRPNRRPEYEEYSDEYEEDRYERRPSGGRRDEDRDNRRPYDRRYEDEEQDRRPSDERRRPEDRRRPSDDDYDRRPYDRTRQKTTRDRHEDDKYERPRKPDDRRTDRYRPKDEDKSDDRRQHDRPRKTKDEAESDERRQYERPRKTKDEDQPDERRQYDRPRKTKDDESEERRHFSRPKKPDEDRRSDTKILVRPNSGTSVYDRPRAPPIIRRPVPKTERNKFEYKTTGKPDQEPEEEYYDDYEEVTTKVTTTKPTRKPNEDRRSYSNLGRPRRPQLLGSKRDRPRYETSTKKQQQEEEEYEDEYEEATPSSPIPKESTTQTISTTVKETTRERPEPIVRIVKRPFLPSRGGNPYAARGLQPVGSKAIDTTTESHTIESNNNTEASKNNTSSEEPFYEDDDDDDEFKPVTNRPRLPIRTTPKPKSPENYRNPLDINESEYDVTLNDALNPTLPNLPVRGIPTGFSTGRESYQRPRLLTIENPTLTQAGSEYVYHVKQPQQRYNPYVTIQQLRPAGYYATYQ